MASLETTPVAADSAPEESPIAVRLPLSTRIKYFVRGWIFKSVVRAYIWYDRYRKDRISPGLPYSKTYPVGTNIASRVFIPASYKNGDPPLPLFIDIHGGGFSIGAPPLDDSDNLILSQEHGFCVVSIGYRLAPSYPFPTAVYDLAATIRAVLNDSALPVDKSKVAVGGYSAGGNLSLAATQLDNLHREIKGVVAYYPTTDFALSREKKLQLSTPPPGKVDTLSEVSKLFNWAYVSPGQDKRDPLLSPHHAERRALPQKLYILGCEFDMLCPEAERTAEKMAQAEDGEKVFDAGGNGWTKGSVRWRKILGAEHGFNQQPDPSAYHGTGEGSKKEIKDKATRDMHADVARWLKKEVFA
jgi:acetyl esterase/lipase